MADRDAEREEAYNRQYDTEHGAQFIDAGGNTISADSIRARLSADHQAAIDAKLASWFTAETDVYDGDGLLDIGRHHTH